MWFLVWQSQVRNLRERYITYEWFWLKATEYPAESAQTIWPIICPLTMGGSRWSLGCSAARRRLAQTSSSLGLPLLTARWRSGSEHYSLTASKQEGRRPTKGLSLSLPVSPLKQEETLRLSAVFLGQNSATWPSLEWQRRNEGGMVYLDPEAGHIVAQVK